MSESMDCDFCKRLVGVKGSDYVDGKTKMGPWANMCMGCYKKHGIGLGTGRGQHYQTDSQGKRIKIAG